MTDINIPFSEEEIAAAPEALKLINNMFDGAKHMIEFPDAYNKAEVLGKLDEITTLLSYALNAGGAIIEGTLEIHEMTKDPSQ